MNIDIISDTVCPWCYIGKRKLEAALSSREGLAVQIGWRPFQLNPEMPSGGMERTEYLIGKFGSARRADRIYDKISEAGAELGIHFRFDLIKRTPSTLDSHRLVRWSLAAGVQHDLVQRLFAAYFENGEDVGDRRVLVRIAGESGMDADDVRARLAEGADLALVQKEDAIARSMGVSGVPCFIIDRKYAVSGAQDAPVLNKVFDLALNEAVTPEDATVG